MTRPSKHSKAIRAIRGAGVLAAFALAAAVPAAAYAAATVGTDVSSYQLDSQGVPLCDGEEVAFSGDITFITHTTENAAGGALFVQHVNFGHVTATGLTSGSTYQMTEAENYVTTLSGDQSTFISVIDGHLVGSGPNGNTNLQIVSKMTVNADGTVTASFDRFNVTCG